MERKNIKITINHYEHYWLQSVAICQLNLAEKIHPAEQFKFTLPSMLFSVLSMESIINIYGSQLFSHWNQFESTSFVGKIIMISNLLKLYPDFSQEPWQTVEHMKRFRNNLVHAKPYSSSKTNECPKDCPKELFPFFLSYPDRSQKSILKYESIENAKKYLDVLDTIQISWMCNARSLGYDVETVSIPKYEDM